MKQIRLYRLLERLEVSLDVGIDRTTLGRFENGEYQPTIYCLLRLARVYRWPLSGFDPDQPLLDPITLLSVPPALEPEE